MNRLQKETHKLNTQLKTAEARVRPWAGEGELATQVCYLNRGGGLGRATRHPTKANGLNVVLQRIQVKDGAGVCPPHLQVFREEQLAVKLHGSEADAARPAEAGGGENGSLTHDDASRSPVQLRRLWVDSFAVGRLPHHLIGPLVAIHAGVVQPG